MEEEQGATLDQITTLVYTTEALQTLLNLLSLHLLEEDGSQVSNLTETWRYVCMNYCFYILSPFPYVQLQLELVAFQSSWSYFCHETKTVA